MKISLNTIRQYIDFELPPVDELVERINMQLGQVEEVVDLAEQYKDVVVVKVVSAEKHPDADRLSVCWVDDGGVVSNVERNADGYVQVVCGAPNVHADMFAAWLPPRSTVPASFGTPEPFVLGARELRGVMSNGMLAAADELAFGSDHEGIIEITVGDLPKSKIQNLKSGEKFAELFDLDDTVIDIENKMFTHRPDCFGQLGVAREISGILGHKFSSPDWYLNAPKFGHGEGLELNVFNEAADKVPRFMAVAVKNIEVRPSPLWLQVELIRMGGKSINNIVDATNYVMLLTGQPTHAYDYDTLRGATLGVRMAREGEVVTLLNSRTYELTTDDIVIVDGEDVVGLGGVMGGGNSEVSSATKNIVLEVANFDMYAIRKTSMRYGLFTDAVTRFSKGQSPLQNDRVLQLLMTMVGGEQASRVFDIHAMLEFDARDAIDFISADFINKRLGLKLSDEEIVSILQNVEIGMCDNCLHDTHQDDLHMHTIPFWRTDLELPEDIVEEVGRLYGFEKLTRELPKRSIAPAAKNPIFVMKKQVRELLKAAGANEVVIYSFVHENLLKRAEQDSSQAFGLSNALSPDLQYYRLSLVPSLLAHIHANIKAGYDEFALFEFGKAHRKGDVDEEGLPREYPRLGFVYAAKKGDGTVYYTAHRYVELLTPGLAYRPLSSFDASSYPIFEQLAAPFEPTRSAVLMNGEKFVGVVGEFKSSVCQAFKLPERTAGFELFQSHLLSVSAKSYMPLSKYPSVTQDISLKVANDLTYDVLLDALQDELEQQELFVTTLAPLSIYQSPDDTTHKTITLRLEVTSYEKTLTDKEVSEIVEQLAAVAAKELHAEYI